MKKILSLLIAATIATSCYGLEEHWIIDSGVIQIDKQQDGRYSYSFWRKGRDTNDSPDELIHNGTFDCDEERFFCHATGGGNEYYTFIQGNKKYIIHPPGGITSESSPIASIEIYNDNKLVLDKYLCDTERCLNRAKDESNEKLVFEGFSNERNSNLLKNPRSMTEKHF